MYPKKEHILNLFGKEPETFDEFADCFKLVVNSTQASPWVSSRHKNTQPVYHKLIGLCWRIEYTPLVSNSHSAPLNGTINWFRNDDSSPKGYPGFVGRIWVRFKQQPISSSDIIIPTLTHTGSGGAGSYNGIWDNVSIAHHKLYGYKQPSTRPHCYSWDWKFFLSDWPGMEKFLQPIIDEYEKQRNWSILKNPGAVVKRFKFEHEYEWTDPDTKMADQILLEYFESVQKETI